MENYVAWSMVVFMDAMRNGSDLGNALEQSKKSLIECEERERNGGWFHYQDKKKYG